MDFVILETNIYEVIYGVYIYMYVSEGQSKRVLHACGISLTRFVSVATGARRKDKRGIPERSCKAWARSEALSVKA